MTKKMKFSVITYNVFATVAPPVRFCSQATRMRLIPGEIARLDADAVVVQESIVPSQHKILSEGMQKYGYRYETKPLSKLGKLVNGGVVIFSRHEIVKQVQHVFDGPCDGSDCLAAKGFTYAKILKFGQPVNLVGTHFQAWPNARSREIRRSQATQVGRFLKTLEHGQMTVLAGDLNVDLYSERRHLLELLDILECEVLEATGHPFTSDPGTNFLMGNDETDAYSSVEYEGGCYNEHMRTGSCPCAPQEWLDYVLIPRTAMQPEGRMKCVKLKVTTFLGQVNATTWRQMNDASDHYPVLAELAYKDVDELELPPLPVNEKKTDWVRISVMFLFGVVIVCAMLGILAYIYLQREKHNRNGRQVHHLHRSLRHGVSRHSRLHHGEPSQHQN